MLKRINRQRKQSLTAILPALAFAVGTLSGWTAAESEDKPQVGGDECICETLCTAEAVKADCPVCGADRADLTVCKGTETSAPSDTLKLTADEVQAMVDALPSPEELKDMGEDEKREVYDRFRSALDAFEALTEEEQAAVGTERAEKLERLGEAFNREVAVQSNVVYVVNLPTSLVAGGDECQVTLKDDYSLEGGKVRVRVGSGVDEEGRVTLTQGVGSVSGSFSISSTLKMGRDGRTLCNYNDVAVFDSRGYYINNTNGKLYLTEPNYKSTTPRGTYTGTFNLEVLYIAP